MAQSVDQLRAEIAQIDVDLQKLADREQAAALAADELALQAYRGDKKAEAKITKHDTERDEAVNWRRRLQVARAGVEGELAAALALEKTEENKARAREAREINAIFRKRGADLDTGIRAFVDNYKSLRDDAAALANLGVRSINSELVRVNSLRSLIAALQRTDLGLPMVPPLQRHSFASLVEKWASMADGWIASVLSEAPPPAPQTNGHAVEDMPSPAVIDATDDDPNFTIKPVPSGAS